MAVVSSVALEQGTNHCVYLHTRREYVAYESHLTLASSILIESMLPSRVVLYLFDETYPMLATSSHTHLSWPSPIHIVLKSHDIHTFSLVSC